jgi:hypothetical protein
VDTQTPDLLLTYHVGLKEKVDVSSYGYRWGWYGPSSVDVWQYTEGTLAVDFIDGGSKDMVWRGYAVEVVGDPKNQEKRINAAVKKLFKKFPPKPKKP